MAMAMETRALRFEPDADVSVARLPGLASFRQETPGHGVSFGKQVFEGVALAASGADEAVLGFGVTRAAQQLNAERADETVAFADHLQSPS